MVQLVERVTGAVDDTSSSHEAAHAVAELLAATLPAGADLLTGDQCGPNSERYCQHVAYVDPAARFSIVSLVWLPGQVTPIHDHACWCVVGVVLGREEEARFTRGADGQLHRTEVLHNDPGSVSCLVPPTEDIHQVRAVADGLTVSLHVYGDDIAARGSSIRRTYSADLLAHADAAHPAPLEPAAGTG